MQQPPVPSDTQYYNQYYYPSPQQIISADQPQYVYVSPNQGAPQQYIDAMTQAPVQPVQYVPYYYYYPVPAETYSNMNMVNQENTINNNLNNVNNNASCETQFKDQIKSSISSSSECSLQHKVN